MWDNCHLLSYDPHYMFGKIPYHIIVTIMLWKRYNSSYLNVRMLIKERIKFSLNILHVSLERLLHHFAW